MEQTPDDAWGPQGAAALDHLRGRRPAIVRVHVLGGEAEDVDAATFFRDEADMEPWEPAALDRCSGRVLDVGAGAGCHALALRRRGLDVVAIDTCRAFVEVLRERGLPDARLADPADVDDGPFDRALLLMHGLGLAGDEAGLRRMLGELRRLLAPGGCVLVDSRDPGEACEDPEAPGLAVAELRMSYRGREGAPFPWLFASEEALGRLVAAAGWRAEVVRREPDGRYLAELRPV